MQSPELKFISGYVVQGGQTWLFSLHSWYFSLPYQFQWTTLCQSTRFWQLNWRSVINSVLFFIWPLAGFLWNAFINGNFQTATCICKFILKYCSFQKFHFKRSLQLFEGKIKFYKRRFYFNIDTCTKILGPWHNFSKTINPSLFIFWKDASLSFFLLET